ncbi:unnamed protein product [Auanema sp. JU1783]|nr:unnamed protein product [Auanema sp. JU1783]
MKKLSKKASADEQKKINSLIITLGLCTLSFAHYIVNPLALPPATMLTISLVSTIASFLPLASAYISFSKKMK